MTVRLNGTPMVLVRIGSRGDCWPAYRTDDGTVVDLRLFPKYAPGAPDLDTLGWYPDRLPRDLPPDLVASAAQSDPPGFVLLAGPTKAP